MARGNLSTYIAFLLRHRPEVLGLNIDRHGWVDVQELIEKISEQGRYPISLPILERMVVEDNKGRYRFNEDKSRIKACQGHTIPWVEPELQQMTPPQYLYHGTTQRAWALIQESGEISRMKRHAVHMQSEEEKAWLSACRRKGEEPVVLKIDAQRMNSAGFAFWISDNAVWFAESVPKIFICEVLDKR